jgi:hypothetical protein
MRRSEITEVRSRPVEVMVDGTWVDGWLEAYGNTAGVWSARVRLSSHADSPAEWVEGRRIRGREPSVTSARRRFHL